jgi:subtilisin
MITYSIFNLIGNISSNHWPFISGNTESKNIILCVAICSVLLLLLLISDNKLIYPSNFALEAYPVEVTGKLQIEPPQCQDNEEYDAISDTCKQISSPGNGPEDPSSDPSGPPPSPNPPGEVTPEGSSRPNILTANASDVETKAGGEIIPFQQIVIVNNSVAKDAQSVQSTIQALTDIVENQGAEVIYTYNSVITGFTFKAPSQQVADDIINVLSSDPRVNFVEQDKTVVPFSEEIPTGIQRIDANELYSIPKIGSFTADVDIAIIDSGIDLDNPELNVNSSFSMRVPQIHNARETDLESIINNNIDLDKLGLNIFAVGGNTTSFYPPFTTSGSSSADDTCGHGTRVAGIAAANADAQGVVGIAPNARLWAIKVLDYDKTTGRCEGSISSVIAAIEYITRLKDKIEVVNLSLGCKCNSTALDDAISRSVKANITYVVAAGNMNVNASSFSPANHKDANDQKDVITVSAITDLDGKCGGHKTAQWIKAGEFAGLYDDDAFAKFSNYGSVVDIAAPGVMIKSTGINGSYSFGNGTSIAAPHVTGAAALYKILNPSSTPSEIRTALMSDGIQNPTVCDGLRHGYFEKDSDGVNEPLLYVDELVKKVKQRYENINDQEKNRE